MTVKILIKREVPKGKEDKLKELIVQLREPCIRQPGYISGESLKNVARPDEYLVISTWKSLDAWNAWLDSKEREKIQRKIDALLGTETEYEIYEYGL